MDLFTYLMAKKGHNTGRDLFSYLLGKNAGGSGTYTTFSGTSLNISNTLQAKIKNIALEGNTSQDGDPTPDTPIPIKVVTGEQNVEISGKNLFNLYDHTNTLDDYTTIISPNKYTCNASSTWKGRVIVPISNFKKNTDYTFSYTSNSTRTYINEIRGIKDGVTTIISNGAYYYYVKKFTINTSDYDEIVIDMYARGNGGTATQITVSNLQLEEGTQATEYVPYQLQNYPLSLGNIELFRNYTDETKIYTDYIFKNEIGSPYYNSSLDKNSWYKYNRNKKIELKNYNYTSSVTKRTNTILFLGNVTGKIHSRYYCNILSSYHYNTLINSDIEGIGHGGGYANRLYISVNKDRLDGYTDELTNSQLNTLLKQFLEDNNAYAWYVLSTSTYEKITNTTLIQQLENINNARSYKGATIIECTSESADNETIGFSGDIKVTSVGLGNSLNISLLSNNIQEEPNFDDVNEIEETSLDDTDEIEETLSIENEIKDEVSE